jgi:hypothetical protein
LIESGSTDKETVHGWKHEIHLDTETWSEQKDAEVYEQNILRHMLRFYESRWSTGTLNRLAMICMVGGD